MKPLFRILACMLIIMLPYVLLAQSPAADVAASERLSWGLEVRAGLSPVLSLGKSAEASSHALGFNTEVSALLPRNPDSVLEFSIPLGAGAAAPVPVSPLLSQLDILQLHGGFRTAYRLSPRLVLELQAGGGLIAHRLELVGGDPEWYLDPLFLARLGLRINPPSRQRMPGYGLVLSPAYLLHGGAGGPGQYMSLDILLRFVWQ